MSAPTLGRALLALLASAALGGAAVLGAAACTDFEAPEPVVLPDVEVAAPSFSRHIQPIFEARCATAGCHTNVTRQNKLALEPLDTAHVHARRYVNIADPDASFLVQIVRHPVGNVPRMPLGLPPLTENQIQTIVNWIEQGALKN